MWSEKLLEKYKKHKDEIFSFLTSLLVYIIMLPLIYVENKRIEPRYVDFDFLFIHLKQMPMVLYILILTVLLATTVNFFRDILGIFRRYFESKIPDTKKKEDALIETSSKIVNKGVKKLS